MQRRVYVKAHITVDEQGSITPISINYQGEQYEIDRLMEPPRPAAALKAGGIGMRYVVRIRGQVTYLFQDDAQRWFVEKKEPGDAKEYPRFEHHIPKGMRTKSF